MIHSFDFQVDDKKFWLKLFFDSGAVYVQIGQPLDDGTGWDWIRSGYFLDTQTRQMKWDIFDTWVHVLPKQGKIIVDNYIARVFRLKAFL